MEKKRPVGRPVGSKNAPGVKVGRPVGSKRVDTELLSMRIDKKLVDFFKENLGKKWLIKKIKEEKDK